MSRWVLCAVRCAFALCLCAVCGAGAGGCDAACLLAAAANIHCAYVFLQNLASMYMWWMPWL